MDYFTFSQLKGCTTCVHFPGPYFKNTELESPIECFDCWDNIEQMFSNYKRKRY